MTKNVHHTSCLGTADKQLSSCLKYQTNQNQMKNRYMLLFVFQVLKVSLIKNFKIARATRSFISCFYQLLHQQIYLYHFFTNFQKFIQYYLQKRFSPCHEFSYNFSICLVCLLLSYLVSQLASFSQARHCLESQAKLGSENSQVNSQTLIR